MLSPLFAVSVSALNDVVVAAVAGHVDDPQCPLFKCDGKCGVFALIDDVDEWY
jgi:hypothetical protein